MYHPQKESHPQSITKAFCDLVAPKGRECLDFHCASDTETDVQQRFSKYGTGNGMQSLTTAGNTAKVQFSYMHILGSIYSLLIFKNVFIYLQFYFYVQEFYLTLY